MTTTIKNKFFSSKSELQSSLDTLIEWCKNTGKQFEVKRDINGFPCNCNSFVDSCVTITTGERVIYCNFELPVCYRKW